MTVPRDFEISTALVVGNCSYSVAVLIGVRLRNLPFHVSCEKPVEQKCGFLGCTTQVE